MKTYIKFACVYCGQHLECKPELSGRQFHCPACHQRLVVPPRPEQEGQGSSKSLNATWETQVADPNVETPTRYLYRNPAP